jgi:hypothetical protein
VQTAIIQRHASGRLSWPEAPERPLLAAGEVHVWLADLEQDVETLRGCVAKTDLRHSGPRTALRLRSNTEEALDELSLTYRVPAV